MFCVKVWFAVVCLFSALFIYTVRNGNVIIAMDGRKQVVLVLNSM